jgi:hypothetical protein
MKDLTSRLQITRSRLRPVSFMQLTLRTVVLRFAFYPRVLGLQSGFNFLSSQAAASTCWSSLCILPQIKGKTSGFGTSPNQRLPLTGPGLTCIREDSDQAGHFHLRNNRLGSSEAAQAQQAASGAGEERGRQPPRGPGGRGGGEGGAEAPRTAAAARPELQQKQRRWRGDSAAFWSPESR